MLGKAIKNEFVNREKPLLLIFLAIFGMGIVVRVFRIIQNASDNTVATLMLGLVSVVYGISLTAAGVITFFAPVKDFRDRMFKDQGYLTHTLPLSIPTLLCSRIVMDLFTMLQISIFFPLSMVFAAGTKDVFKQIVDFITIMVKIFTKEVNSELVGTTLILALACVAAQYLTNTWIMCAGYTIGHSVFNKEKRVLSIIFTILIAILFVTFFGTLVNSLFNDVEIDMFNDIDEGLELANKVLLLLLVIQLVATAINITLVGIIFKKKLNLE